MSVKWYAPENVAVGSTATTREALEARFAGHEDCNLTPQEHIEQGVECGVIMELREGVFATTMLGTWKQITDWGHPN